MRAATHPDVTIDWRALRWLFTTSWIGWHGWAAVAPPFSFCGPVHPVVCCSGRYWTCRGKRRRRRMFVISSCPFHVVARSTPACANHGDMEDGDGVAAWSLRTPDRRAQTSWISRGVNGARRDRAGRKVSLSRVSETRESRSCLPKMGLLYIIDSLPTRVNALAHREQESFPVSFPHRVAFACALLPRNETTKSSPHEFHVTEFFVACFTARSRRPAIYRNWTARWSAPSGTVDIVRRPSSFCHGRHS